jgi:hypothetical protein
MNFLKKIYKNYLYKYNFLNYYFDELKIQLSKNFLLDLDLNLDKIKRLDQVDYKVFSQNGEDGIIQYLIKSLKLKNIKFVEIGTEDYIESNTRYIFETMRCDGLIIDPLSNLEKKIKANLKNFWKNNLKIHNNFVNSQNIIKILKRNEFQNDIDLFSIDIDGIDYWIIKKLRPEISKIFVAEYNAYFGPELEITVPNIKNFNRNSYHYSNLCWGVSLKSLIKIMVEKNYTFVGTNNFRNNAFFISNQYINQIKIRKPNIKNLSEFTDAKYNENRNKFGNLTYHHEKLSIIKDCEVINLKNNKLTKISKII